MECYKFKLVDPSEVFVDATHVKARANNKKMQKRIAHAERLLIEPHISLTEGAMLSGFNSLSTFNRIFKAAKNCMPSEYKNLNRLKE